jgi:hypothetical protein
MEDAVAEVVDISLSSLGLAASVSLLGVLETMLGRTLFVPPMLASGIIFFAPPTPPSPNGFISGTIGCASLSAAVLFLLTGRVPAVVALGAAAGALLIWYRVTHTFFPPAAVLCVLMLGVPKDTSPYSWLVTTWLAGHAWLYASAMSVSALRRHARTIIGKQRAGLSKKEC